MASAREAALSSLYAALQSGLSFDVLRNEVDLVAISRGEALAVLYDGTPGEPEVMLSPLTYEYEHQADLQLVVDAENPDATFDAAASAVGAIVLADRTLGGTCDWVEAGAPETGVDLPVEGGGTLKAAIIPIRLVYSTGDPLN